MSQKKLTVDHQTLSRLLTLVFRAYQLDNIQAIQLRYPESAAEDLSDSVYNMAEAEGLTSE